eukprot:TRINITY_DN6850_c0_g1_i2.p1 TRINITY_DN6850_c0_g1~~TRINITY_DN6850_c0_g1_i2.p1  ORF type:complete len:458 (-),score=47.57 TRINITY_DN6850_c0_g1_i2:607-1899(-)
MSCNSQSNQQDLRVLMPPPAPKFKKRSKVELLEEEYQAVLRSLIQRDYFPDTQKMLNKIEWLRAQRSGKAETISLAQINIAKRNAGIHTPLLGEPAKEDVEEVLSGICPPGMSLTTFLNKFTSEDNASFQSIVEKDISSKRLKYSHLIRPPQNQHLLAAPSKDHRTDGFGTGNQSPKQIQYLTEKDKNALFYDSSQQTEVQLTDTEMADQAQGPPKQIVSKNTRLGSSVDQNPDDLPETPSTVLSTPNRGNQAQLQGREEDDTAKQLQPQQLRVQAQQYIPSPSPVPGNSTRTEDASPFMTWGQLATTPVKLDTEYDRNLANTSEPQFRVPETSARELAANSLARKAGQSLRRKDAQQGVAPLLRNLKSPISVGLSEAGFKLAQKMGKIKGLQDEGSDELGLRASYLVTPKSTPRSRKTPKCQTISKEGR